MEPLSVRCPTCAAWPDQPCTKPTPSANRAPTATHKDRIALARVGGAPASEGAERTAHS